MRAGFWRETFIQRVDQILVEESGKSRQQVVGGESGRWRYETSATPIAR